MKRILPALLFLACSAANAQFVTGQILTAAQLNAAFANVLATSGGTLTGPLTVQGNTTVANLTVNGTFTVPGGFSPSSLAPQAANSLLGNASGATAAPSVIAVPSCSASGNALKWTSASGFTCGTGNALTANPLSQFAATTSAQLLGVISDETGSGSAVFGTSPTLTTPAITGGTINNASVGATTASTGAFTTLSASGTVSGVGFTNLLSPYLTTSTAASTYATIAQATTALAATGGFINGVTVGLTTPAASKVTTLVATSTITPSSTAGIVGTTTNDNANTGSVGEFVTANAAGVSLSTGVTANVTSISLTAGDWDVSGMLSYLPSGTTTMSALVAGTSTTSATLGTFDTWTRFQLTFTTGTGQQIPAPVTRYSLSATTTVFLVANAAFGASTMTVSGLIRARRVR